MSDEKKLRKPEFWLLSEEEPAAEWRARAALEEWAGELASFRTELLRRRRQQRAQRRKGNKHE